MALTLISLTLVQPTAALPTGAVQIAVQLAAPATAPLTIFIPGLTTGYVPLTQQPIGYLYFATGVAPGSYTALVRDDSGAATLSVPFTLFALPTTERTPPALVAAHLPVLAVLRAAPRADALTGLLAPTALLLVVEVRRGTSWQPAGQLRGVCDATLGTARFNLSEYLKTQFADTPPDETGGFDAALAIAYRVRYGAAADFDGSAGAEGGTFAGLALNAAEPVLATALPLALLAPSPYASVPVGYAGFRSTVDATGAGVANVPTVPASASGWPCPVRQFVWLAPSGAWAWGLFSGRHEHGTETSEDAIVRRSGGADYYVGGGDVRPTLRVYSDKLDWPTFQALRGIRRARRVYERLPSGLYVPVLVEKGSAVDYKETDKTFEVNFTARYPVLPVQTF